MITGPGAEIPSFATALSLICIRHENRKTYGCPSISATKEKKVSHLDLLRLYETFFRSDKNWES